MQKHKVRDKKLALVALNTRKQVQGNKLREVAYFIVDMIFLNGIQYEFVAIN